MTLSREQMLVEMGLGPIWRLREAGSAGDSAATASPEAGPSFPMEPVAETPPPAPARPPASDAAVDALAWPELKQRVADCRACPLCQQRRQAVFGVGNEQATWLFVGEGPGADEDAQGEPFVGQAGKLLDNMLAALDIARGEQVYIANAVKCRPPGNRTPEAAEMAACRPYLERQIALIRPKIIVLLGKAAVHSVLHQDKALGSMRGQRHDYQGIPVVVTYHPAYLLRNPADKARVWEDLCLARASLNNSKQGDEQ